MSPGSDELDEAHAEWMKDPAYARWWHWARCRDPGKLPIDGREYHRRQNRRRGRHRRQ